MFVVTFECVTKFCMVCDWFLRTSKYKHVSSSEFHNLVLQGGQDIMSMMGQLMKPKKTEITGKKIMK